MFPGKLSTGEIISLRQTIQNCHIPSQMVLQTLIDPEAFLLIVPNRKIRLEVWSFRFEKTAASVDRRVRESIKDVK